MSILTTANAKAYCATIIPESTVLGAAHAIDCGQDVVNVEFLIWDHHTNRSQQWTLTVWVESNGELYGEW